MRLRVLRLLGVLLALASGGVLVAGATGAWQLPSRSAQGLLLGFLAGVFGALCFWLGAASVQTRSRGSPRAPREPEPSRVSPEDAKRWLQKFLVEQQKQS